MRKEESAYIILHL